MMIIVSELRTKYDNPKPESVNIHPPAINYIRKSREKRLITKEHIAMHTHLNFKFKPLYIQVH